MESLLSILLLVLLLLIYFSNRENQINRRCALAGFIFWLGLAKEAVAYNLIPFLETTLAVKGLAVYFLLPYSLMTWALYTLAIPTAILFALTLGEKVPAPAARGLSYLPAALLSCVFVPWQYPVYQRGNPAFWATFAVYNLLGCALFALLILRALKRETDAAAHAQKRLVAFVMLPPVLFWGLSAFLPHVFQLTFLDKLWQINALILLACIVFYVVLAFRGGMMGLRLTGESYRWNSDMGLIRRGASYTGHMIKNQTAKMAWCVENLTSSYDAQGARAPEELKILARAIAALQTYCERAARYANAILLDEGVHSLEEMLNDAFSLCARASQEGASLSLTGISGLAFRCDRSHMTEVFVNLFTNALEAMSTPSPIEVSASPEREGGRFVLCIADHGRGMRPEDAAHIFDPYFTTKASPENLGLGLSYCKNVILKHGGTLAVRSQEGKGTTMLLSLPARRILPLSAQPGKEAIPHA